MPRAPRPVDECYAIQDEKASVFSRTLKNGLLLQRQKSINKERVFLSI
jgi:hypothetical protein